MLSTCGVCNRARRWCTSENAGPLGLGRCAGIRARARTAQAACSRPARPDAFLDSGDRLSDLLVVGLKPEDRL